MISPKCLGLDSRLHIYMLYTWWRLTARFAYCYKEGKVVTGVCIVQPGCQKAQDLCHSTYWCRHYPLWQGVALNLAERYRSFQLGYMGCKQQL